MAEVAQRLGESIAVIPGGERWAMDDALRPCVEDYLGAGAILSYLRGTLSPEAQLAVSAFKAVENDLENTIMQCISGQEKVSRNKQEDVKLASALNVSTCVPLLQHKAYTQAPDKAQVFP